jgi:DNA polymerase I-like protein with 3'-5' exonuclease and polymerase domains
MNKVFISKLPVTSGIEPATFYSYNGNVFETYNSMTDLMDEKSQLISFDWDSIVYWLTVREEKMPLDIIDIEQIAKQLCGHKKSPDNPLPWSIWAIVRPFYKEEENDDFIKTQKIHQDLVEVDESEKIRLYQRLLGAMHLCFEKQLIDLQEKGEHDRFYNVERPIRIINLERSYKGISVNTEHVSDWVDALSRDVYKLRNELQLKYNIISANDWKTVINKIESKEEIKEARRLIEEKGYYFFLKDSKLRHPLIELLYSEKKSTSDLNTLLAIGALKPLHKKIFPVYDSFGTVTSRTKVITPNLQNLSRKFRSSIVTAEKGKELLYIDYSQFEAGILADDSKDELLIKDYNESYIYEEIGTRINIETYISDKELQRKFCKNLFYKYSYGMDISQNIGILKDFQLESHSLTLSPLIIAAFAGYSTLDRYREQIKEQLKTENKIGSHNGNFRYRFENEQNLSWAISQRIQGTASLILKKAIIKLRQTDPEIEFLIPMHDAALFQVPKDQEEEKRAVIKSVFENEFAQECPTIKASAEFKDF